MSISINDFSAMIIRQDYIEWPPSMFMQQIINPISKIYMFLWANKDTENRLKLTWKNLTMLYNKNRFRTSVRKLHETGLLNYKESETGILVELVGWDDVSDDD